MQVGVLNAFTPEQEEDIGSKEFDLFVSLFSHVQHDLNFVEYRITENQFPEPAACDAYLITGSPSGAYDSHAWTLRLQHFIRTAHEQGKPLVGICFGHQILAHALGGRTEKSPKGWGLGRDTLHIQAQQPWMSPRKEVCELHYFHQDQVVELPKTALRVAGSEFCPNGLFVIGKSVFGVQAHPEMPEWRIERGINMFRNGRLAADRAVADRAEASLKPGIADGPVLAQWIVNFLRQ